MQELRDQTLREGNEGSSGIELNAVAEEEAEAGRGWQYITFLTIKYVFFGLLNDLDGRTFVNKQIDQLDIIWTF